MADPDLLIRWGPKKFSELLGLKGGALSPLQRLLLWGISEKTGGVGVGERKEKSGVSWNMMRRTEWLEPLIWLSSFQASQTHFKFPSPQSLCAFFSPLHIPMPKLQQKRPLRRREGLQNFSALQTLKFLPIRVEAPLDLPLVITTTFFTHLFYYQ